VKMLHPQPIARVQRMCVMSEILPLSYG